ncbi:MAG TPA: ASCH domain-containing protein [Ktedonobacterales bacterium]
MDEAASHALALSVQQPYAEAILSGRKRIEVRTWRTFHRGTLYIHAGRTWYGTRDLGTKRAYRDAAAIARHIGLPEQIDAYPRGALVGRMRVIDCFDFDPQTWEATRALHWCDFAFRSGLIGWRIEMPERLARPIPLRGSLGVFPITL